MSHAAIRRWKERQASFIRKLYEDTTLVCYKLSVLKIPSPLIIIAKRVGVRQGAGQVFKSILI